MITHTSTLVRRLLPAGLGALLIAGASLASAQGSGNVRVLTLDDAMRIALETSPTMIRQEANLERGRLSLKAAEAELKAQFSLRLSPYTFKRGTSYDDYAGEWYNSDTQSSSASFNVTQPVMWTDGTLTLSNSLSYNNNKTENRPESTRYQSGLSLSYSQPLFQYNDQKMSYEALQRDYRTTELDYIENRLNLERQVTQWCYTLYQAKISLETAEADFDRSKTNLEMTRNKVEAGLLAQNELNQQLVTYADSELSYEESVQSYEDAKDTFRMNLGLPLDEDVDVSLDIEHRPVAIDADLAVEQALANSFDLIRTEMGLLDAEDNLIKTKSQNSISGSVDLSYGLSSTEEEIADLYKTPTKDQSVNLGVTIPIFDWGVRDARVRSQEISYEQSVYNADEERKQLILTVRQSCRDLDRQLRSYDIAVQRYENAQITYDISVEQFGNGELSALDLQQQQQQLTSAEQSVTQVLVNYKLGILELKNTTLYDFEAGRPVDTEAYLGEDN